MDTAEQGEVIAVDYDEAMEEYIFLVRLADGREGPGRRSPALLLTRTNRPC